MTIADFTLTRQLTYRNGAPASGTRRLFAHLQARRHGLRRRRALPERDPRPPARPGQLVRLSGEQRRGAAEHGLARELPGARRLHRQRDDAADRGRLLQRREDTPCTTAGGGAIAHLISGARVVLNDPTRAGRLGRGLRPAGRRAPQRLRRRHARRQRQRRHPPGRDRRPQRRRRSSAAEDYGAGARTDSGATCSPRMQARPARTSATRPSARPSLAAGQRTLKVRVIDAAGNITEQGPYVVDVVTPSDRGPLNGSGATDGGTLTRALHRRQAQAPQDRRLPQARARSAAGCSTPPGKPVSGALLKILTRDRRSGARFVQRWRPPRSPTASTRSRCAARRLAARAGRVGVAHPRPEPAGERLRDAQRARVVVAARDAAGGRRRPVAAPARHRARRRSPRAACR